MKVRIFNHYHNLPIALLAVVETLLILSAPLIVQTMFVGQSFESLLDAWQVTAPKILAFVACIGVALTAMGLYSARQLRDAIDPPNPRPHIHYLTSVAGGECHHWVEFELGEFGDLCAEVRHLQ